VVRWAEEQGIEHTKLNLLGNRSWPDRCFWLAGGRPLLMEFKRLGKRPRAQQKAKIVRLTRLGYDAHCVDRKEDGINILKNAIQKRKWIFKISQQLGHHFQAAIQRETTKLAHDVGAEGKLGNADSFVARRSRSAGSVAAKAASQAGHALPARAGVRRIIR
jgi:hypothetical protein